MISMFLANILLAFVWSIAFGGFTPANFLIGMVLGYIAIRIATFGGGNDRYSVRVWRFASFLLYFLWQMLLANIKMAGYTLSPLGRLRPAILAIPLDIPDKPDGTPGDPMTDFEITALANVITLTPGTLSIDVSEDRRALFIHFMHVADRDAVVEEIETGFKARLLGLTR